MALSTGSACFYMINTFVLQIISLLLRQFSNLETQVLLPADPGRSPGQSVGQTERVHWIA
jgi:hypothetical protein